MNPLLTAAYNLTINRYRNGFKQEADAIYQALIIARNHAAAINFMGLILLDQQQYSEAELMFIKAVQLAPLVPEYALNLGSLYEEQQQLPLAEQYFRQAWSINSMHAETLDNLGYVLQLQEKYAEAIPFFKTALPLTDNQCRTLVNLGKCLEECDNPTAASACYHQALKIDPLHAIALHNLAGIYKQQGQHHKAIECYQQAIASQPNFTFSHYNLGITLMHIGNFSAAQQSLLKVLELDSRHILAFQGLGDLCAFQGKIQEATDYYEQILSINQLTGLRIRLATLVPPILESSTHLKKLREDVSQKLSVLAAEPELKIDDPLLEVRDAFFYWSYHHLNNRNLKTQVAQLFEKLCPTLLWEAPHCQQIRNANQPIRIGLISKFFYNHSIGKTSQGFFAKLPRSQFKVYALFIQPLVQDPISDFIQQHADETLLIANTLSKARQQIAELKLDILFYQDIGMDPFSYYLAYARLAPVQCTSFGHPDTTGITNMDYFISSQLFESVEAVEHYSESLALLPSPSLLSYYQRPTLPDKLKSRTELGWEDSDHLYICPQTLFKFHPDFDRVLAAILQQDKQGKILILEGPIAHFAVLLKQRWQQQFSDVAERLIFLPPQSSADFINLIAVSDLMLDIPSFNGMNTSLEAFAVGTPVVTLPGTLQRSRHGFGLYQKMGITACIAKDEADYIAIALRLATDKRFRDTIHKEILEKNHHLFADEDTITAFSRFFIMCIDQHQLNT
ncbi:tetratricopeptide repeat protein [Methylomonas sp. AM2-LC]|uniref:O-linked N-acetylglucosamine transferase, SPINDLY family protein n=1 Tax=Methylomonas sp. AM2-LC TaxID=3153301 RepID=UPI0032679E21